jgi:hypothetical protein
MSTTMSLVIDDFFNNGKLRIETDSLDRVVIHTDFQDPLTISSVNAFEMALWIIRNIKIDLPEDVG